MPGLVRHCDPGGRFLHAGQEHETGVRFKRRVLRRVAYPGPRIVTSKPYSRCRSFGSWDAAGRRVSARPTSAWDARGSSRFPARLVLRSRSRRSGRSRGSTASVRQGAREVYGRTRAANVRADPGAVGIRCLRCLCSSRRSRSSFVATRKRANGGPTDPGRDFRNCAHLRGSASGFSRLSGRLHRVATRTACPRGGTPRSE